MRVRRTFTAISVSAALALLAGCAPTQSAPAAAGGDDQTGTLRMWLFDEASRAPKEAAVDEAITEFKAAHAGVDVDVQWVPVEGRADKFSGAFNDPSNAPDVAEFGNTDVASYAQTGALSDLTGDISSWSEGKDLLPSVLDTAKSGGKTYGLPWYTGIRALYYRTDVFTELGLKPPTTLAELTDDARKIHAAKPDLYGISTGGKYTYALLPFVWANGGDVAKQDGGKWASTVEAPQAKAGITAYANLLKDDICPPAACANLTGTQSVTAFAGGKAGMTIGGDFNRKAVEQGAVKGKYAVVPLPGTTPGSVAPAFAGGNLLGVFGASKRHGVVCSSRSCWPGRSTRRRCTTPWATCPRWRACRRSSRRATPRSSRSWTPSPPARSSCRARPAGRRSTARTCCPPRCSRSRPAARTSTGRSPTPRRR